MTNCIDRDTLSEDIKKTVIFSTRETESAEVLGAKKIIARIEAAPAADVRPVVFCKDCFFYRKDKELAEAAYLNPEEYCALLRVEMGEKSFCSYGRKLEKEEEK